MSDRDENDYDPQHEVDLESLQGAENVLPTVPSNFHLLQTRHGAYIRASHLEPQSQQLICDFLNQAQSTPISNTAPAPASVPQSTPSTAGSQIIASQLAAALAQQQQQYYIPSSNVSHPNPSNVTPANNTNFSTAPSTIFTQSNLNLTSGASNMHLGQQAMNYVQNLFGQKPPNLNLPPPPPPSSGSAPLTFPYSMAPPFNFFTAPQPQLSATFNPYQSFQQNPLLQSASAPSVRPKTNILESTLVTGNVPVQNKPVAVQTADGAIERFHKNCPKFDGYAKKGFAIFSHFNQIEQMFNSYSIAPQDYYIAAIHSFVGSAYAYIHQKSFNTYNDLKICLVRTYGQMHSTRQIRQEFHDLYQGNDSIEVFINKIQDKASELHDRVDPLDERTQLDKLIAGCRREYQWILKLTNPPTMEAAKAALINAEDIAKSNALPTVQTSFVTRGRGQNRRSNNKGYRNRGNRQSNFNYRDNNRNRHSNNNSQNSVSPTTQCWNCMGFGHVRKNCRKSSTDNSRARSQSPHRRSGSHTNPNRNYRGRGRGSGYRGGSQGGYSQAPSGRGNSYRGRGRGRNSGRGRVHDVHSDEFHMDDGANDDLVGPDDSASMQNSSAIDALRDLIPHLNL